ncbi:MAG TPA: AtpZ/AtpI family protein [Pyrinomonadaceae bacterium]|nr:AtpZ/AtpI family protein [Pyrinomonadaceae bacterium]
MPETEDQEVTRKSGLAYAAGIGVFFSVLAFFCAGYFLDRWLGTGPWLLVAGVVVGAAVGFYELVRIMSKIN